MRAAERAACSSQRNPAQAARKLRRRKDACCTLAQALKMNGGVLAPLLHVDFAIAQGSGCVQDIHVRVVEFDI